MNSLGLVGRIQPTVEQYSGASTEALDDIKDTVILRLGEQALDFIDKAYTSSVDGSLGQGQVDVSNFGYFYEDMSDTVRPPSEHTLVVVENDIAVPGQNFVFGLTSPVFRTSIVSPFRIETATSDLQLASQSFRTISRHEVGHQFGLKRLSEKSAEDDSLYAGHCHDTHCTMKQVVSAKELFQLTENLEDRDHFCDDCASELTAMILQRVAKINNVDHVIAPKFD